MKNPCDSRTFGCPSTKSPQTPEAARHTGYTAATQPETVAAEQDDVQALLRGMRPRLFAVALRFAKNPDDAEDIVQEALLRIWRNLDRFEGRAALSTWSHRITVNASLDSLRRQHTRMDRLVESQDEEGTAQAAEMQVEATPESLLGTAEVGSLVRQAIATLSPTHREVLEMRELEDSSYDEIAARARCPVGTVMSRLHHARRRLAGALPRLGQEMALLDAA